MWAGAMFKQIDALPCAKAKLARDHRDRQADRKDRGLDMGRHVVGAFRAVGDPRHGWIVGGRCKASEETLQIMLHARIGVFLDQQRT